MKFASAETVNKKLTIKRSGHRFGSWTDNPQALAKHRAKRRAKMKIQKASRAANRR